MLEIFKTKKKCKDKFTSVIFIDGEVEITRNIGNI